MNETKDEITYHRDEMAFWLMYQKDAKSRGDVATEQLATEEYRKHRDVVLAIWASSTEHLAVCV
ncbi:hypothetical protein [Paenibacillus sp. FSL H7-0714]|uniref:hypothetical protein n=1 Tax=Paenibacillus sp. FSL H7-0714 TaxID=2954735 RepID=UPI0030F8723D